MASSSEPISRQTPRNKRPNAEDDNDGMYNEQFEKKLQEFVALQPYQTYVYETDKPLPDTCLDILSKEGREVLMEAMRTPYMESYLTISSQVDNQPENMCAQTALLVALNALKISPPRATWYGICRWHCFESLVCCTQEKAKANMTKEQFSRLAICNDLQAFPVTVTDALTLDNFRKWVKYCTSRQDVVLMVNFDRIYFNQNGFGHYAPIEGYHEGRDLVLLAEVAKHKYPSYWVPLDQLRNAMNTKDNKTGENRGFILLARPDYVPDERIFGLSSFLPLNENPGDVDTALVNFVNQWTKWLHSQVSQTTTERRVVDKSVSRLLVSIPTHVSSFSLLDLNLVAFRHEHVGQHSIVARCSLPHDPRKCSKASFIRNLQSTNLYHTIHNAALKLSPMEKKRLLGLVHVPFSNIHQALEWNKSKFGLFIEAQKRIRTLLMAKESKGERSPEEDDLSNIDNEANESNTCLGYIQLLPEHVVAIVLLFWPYRSCDESYFHNEITLENFIAKKTITKQCCILNSKTYFSQSIEYLDEPKNVATCLQNISCSVLNPSFMSKFYQEFVALNRKFRVVLNYHRL